MGVWHTDSEPPILFTSTNSPRACSSGQALRLTSTSPPRTCSSGHQAKRWAAPADYLCLRRP